MQHMGRTRVHCRFPVIQTNDLPCTVFFTEVSCNRATDHIFVHIHEKKKSQLASKSLVAVIHILDWLNQYCLG